MDVILCERGGKTERAKTALVQYVHQFSSTQPDTKITSLVLESDAQLKCSFLRENIDYSACIGLLETKHRDTVIGRPITIVFFWLFSFYFLLFLF